MNNCKYAGPIDSTLKICHCDINYATKLAIEIRTSYMEQFDEDFIVHSPLCIFELKNSIETCPYYEK